MSLKTLLQGSLLLLCPLWHTAAHAEWLSRDAAIMGTRVTVELWHEDAAAGDAAIDAVLDEMRRIDRLMSPYKPDSEVSLLNREAAERPVRVSQELFRLLERAARVSRMTDGAFDITFASVGHRYDYRKGIAPTDSQVRAELPGIDYRHVRLHPTDGSVSFARPGVRIDLGGIAKGHAVDRCIALLKGRGIEHALVTAGGDSRLIGDKGGRPWNIGIRAPRDDNAMVAILPLSDSAVSTSGDYERFFEQDGVRHHHIIDPGSGRSARGVQSVTVIGPDATTTDALSTTVFVMGKEKGLALIDRLPGIDAVVVDAAGRMAYSSGLAGAGDRRRPGDAN